MDLRTDRLGLLLDQLTGSVDVSRARFEGLTDDEYLWEPAQPAWSVRRRDAAVTPSPLGRGDWVLDHERDPDPMPVTTIAWRIGHLIDMYAGRWEWTFGARREDPRSLTVCTPVAGEALDALWSQTDRWLADTGRLTDEQLDTVGFGRYPRGLDPQLPFIAVLWWMNREFIHHAAEVALLRDLYRARRDTP
ncbi:MAG: DinB family protein [Mycobacteriales bacterium]